MEDELPTGAEGTEGSRSPREIPPLPPEVSERAQEVRSLVDAGAGSPEELRALAAKLEEQRLLEESAWKRDVKPALIESKKVKLSISDLRPSAEGDRSGIGMAIVLLAVVAVMLAIATQVGFVWLLVPVVAVFVYAWRHGNELESPDDAPAEPSD